MFKKLTLLVFVIMMTGLFAACSGGSNNQNPPPSPNVGMEGGACGEGDRCDGSLICKEGKCVVEEVTTETADPQVPNEGETIVDNPKTVIPCNGECIQGYECQSNVCVSIVEKVAGLKAEIEGLYVNLTWDKPSDSIISNTMIEWGIESKTEREKQLVSKDVQSLKILALPGATYVFIAKNVGDYESGKVFSQPSQITVTTSSQKSPYNAGAFYKNDAFKVDGVLFNMVYVPGGFTFPVGVDNKPGGSVAKGYWIAETEVTYALWKKVLDWATDRAAGDFAFLDLEHKPALKGSVLNGAGMTDNHPVTQVSWRDAMVFMNALTLWFNEKAGTNYDCVYYSDKDYKTPIVTADDNLIINKKQGFQDAPYVKAEAKGFRLPTSREWELAARYLGTVQSKGAIEDSDFYWTPGSYASGAVADYTDFSETEKVAVYKSYSTAEVRIKQANELNIHDMSGNVAEWCFDWYDHPTERETYRVIRGGYYNINDATLAEIQLGKESFVRPNAVETTFGFRPVRTE